jgi:hypothetical protein
LFVLFALFALLGLFVLLVCSLFCFAGTIMLLQQYSKTRNTSGLETAISRFLPYELAHLLLRYLAIVRPVETTFQASLAAANDKPQVVATYQHWLFVERGRRMTAEAIRETFVRKMAGSLILVKFSGYRYRPSLRSGVWLGSSFSPFLLLLLVT